ncbi:hypothetical protein DQ354_19415 [Arthrobacter sp. AQ5-06]|nr:hypothetical protein DQ354_19415 [Arthrobacter sp. AQ5-06]
MDFTLDLILYGPLHATIGVRLMSSDPVIFTPAAWAGFFSATSAGLAQALGQRTGANTQN